MLAIILLLALVAPICAQIAVFEPVTMANFEGEYQMVYGPKALQCFDYVDINNDGVRDIVTSNAGAYINWGDDENPDYKLTLSYLNLEFYLRHSLASTYNSATTRVYYGNFDFDEVLDMLVSVRYSTYPPPYTEIWTELLLSSEYYENNSNFYWYWNEYSNFADINNDGLSDIIYNFDSCYFRINSGDINYPNFSQAPLITLGADARGPLTFGDLDNDSDLDYLCYNNNSVHLFTNNGTPQSPQFTLTSLDYIPSTNGTHYSIGLEDYDLDGDLDLFLDELLYKNDGTVDSAEFIFADSCCISPFPKDIVLMPVYADLDLDGDQDFIPYKYNNNGYIHNLYYYKNTGTVEEPNWHLENNNLLSVYCQYIKDYEFADMDNDGDSDLLMSTESHRKYYRNDMDEQGPHFVLVSNNFWFSSYTNFYFRTVDWDFDSDYDIIQPYCKGIYIFENVGTITQPSFQLTDSINVGIETVNDKISPTVADFDNDGDYDICMDAAYGDPGSYMEYNYYYRNDGTQENPVWTQLNYSEAFSGIGYLHLWGAKVYDFNGDGNLDIFPGAAIFNYCTSQGYSASALYSTGILYFKQTGITGAVEGAKPPEQFDLSLKIQPNPFNQQTVLTFQLTKPGMARVSVFDILGREVEVLQDSYYTTGEHKLFWQADRSSSGVYFIRLSMEGESVIRKAVVLK